MLQTMILVLSLCCPSPASPPTPQQLHRSGRELTPTELRMREQGYRWGWELDGPYSSRRWSDGLYWPDDAGEEPGYVPVGGF